MLLDRILPSRCAHQSDDLQRAAHLHAMSSLAVGHEARKTQARVADFKVTADAAEKRAKARASEIRAVVEEVLSSPGLRGLPTNRDQS